MTMQPLASVIIPCYNCEKYIIETLESMEAQCRRDFEVICVNDGSKDNTLAVLREWKENHCLEMQILDKANGGVSSARNCGIRAAKGKYLFFCDADDTFHPQYLECLISAMEETAADTAYCLLSRDFEKVKSCIPSQPVYIRKTQEAAMHDLLYRMGEIGFYCYAYRREILEQNAILFDENTRYFEDREFNWKYLSHCQNTACVEFPLYWYRVTPNSATTKKVIEWRTDSFDAEKRVEEYLEKMGCSFLSQVKDYLLPRVFWAYAKNYALGGNKEAFKRLGREYNGKKCMKRTARDSNKLVMLASMLYLIHPMLFYYAIRLKT